MKSLWNSLRIILLVAASGLLITSCNGDSMTRIDILEGIVWFDQDEDGILDEDEEGVEGVMIHLFSLGDEETRTTYTDKDGAYVFRDTGKGTRYLQFEEPEGYHFTEQHVGDNVWLDSDADPLSGYTENFEHYDDDEGYPFHAGLIMELIAELPPTPEPPPKDVVYALHNYYELIEAPEEYRYSIDDLLKDDAMGDWIFSLSQEPITNPRPGTDILKFGGFMSEYNPEDPNPLFNPRILDCEGEESTEYRLICPQGAVDLVPGFYWFMIMQLDAPIPLNDTSTHYTYSVVVDQDGEIANNLKAAGWDWDYYLNTDRWYEATWNPSLGPWGLDVSDLPTGIYSNAKTNARVLIVDEIVVFMIPGDEVLTKDQILARFTGFGHDGSFMAPNSSGDVSGANPAEDPLMFEGIIGY